MTAKTLCWNCNASYPITDLDCPACMVANGNTQPELAQRQQDGIAPDILQILADQGSAPWELRNAIISLAGKVLK